MAVASCAELPIEKQTCEDLKSCCDPYQDPLNVTEAWSLKCPGPSYQEDFAVKAHGKWLIFKNFEELNYTWCVVREAVRSGQLGAIGAKCSTLKYNPLYCRGGPITTGKITVFAKQENYMEVGKRLIRLCVVRHDIKYKTMRDTFDQRFTHTCPNSHIARLTLFWNNGRPSTKRTGSRCPPKCRDDRRRYNPSTDIWKINVVEGSDEYRSEPYGWWIIKSNYDAKSEVNISNLWHALKPRVEKGEIPAIRMKCPASKRDPKIHTKTKNPDPEIHVFTSKGNIYDAGKKIIPLLENDIVYEVASGGTCKTLYWNDGNPSWRVSSLLSSPRFLLLAMYSYCINYSLE